MDGSTLSRLSVPGTSSIASLSEPFAVYQIDTLDSLDNAIFEVNMGAFAAKPDRDLELGEVIETLSPEAARFVVDHPQEAKLALRVALETAAQQYSSTPAALRSFFVESKSTQTDDELLSAVEASERLKVSRATVYNWIDDGRLLAWRLTRQGVVIPAEQIIAPGEVVRGIAEVVDAIGDAKTAWRFLTETSPFFDTPMRPIDVLKKGALKSVLDAARAHGDSFT